MIFIKHRANDLSLKYDGPIEIDVWGPCETGGRFFVGHELNSVAEIPDSFEFSDSVWVHCKEMGAFKALAILYPKAKLFLHGGIIVNSCEIVEPVAVVQGGYYWTTRPLNVCGLTVFMDVFGTKYSIEEIAMIRRGHGVCSDHPEKWKELFS